MLGPALGRLLRELGGQLSSRRTDTPIKKAKGLIKPFSQDTQNAMNTPKIFTVTEP